MIRIDARTVELTDWEVRVRDSFDLLLDHGLTAAQALMQVRQHYGPAYAEPDFWAWLGRDAGPESGPTP